MQKFLLECLKLTHIKFEEMYTLKINKKMSALICGALMAITSVSFATVRADQVTLGDLPPGMKVSQVKDIYGEPHQTEGDKWIYRGFYIEVNDRHSRVEEIVTEDGGFATADGIIVGMSEEALNKAYGKADKLEVDSYDVKEYEYYSSDRKYKMEFKVRNGIITKIKCEEND